jgi:hypothetical protein
MGLGLPTTGSGDFINYCKYNAKAGRWSSKYDKDDVREVNDMTALFNFAEIKTGRMLFGDGAAPDKHFDSAIGAGDAECPSDKHKVGFEVHIYSEKNIGGLREFCSTAGIVNDTMNELYDEYEKQAASHPGEMPVVRCTSVEEVKGSHGVNYRPILEIVGWAPWPDMGDDAPQAPAAAPAAPAVPPPAPAAPAPGPELGDAF